MKSFPTHTHACNHSFICRYHLPTLGLSSESISSAMGRTSSIDQPSSRRLSNSGISGRRRSRSVSGRLVTNLPACTCTHKRDAITHENTWDKLQCNLHSHMYAHTHTRTPTTHTHTRARAHTHRWHLTTGSTVRVSYGGHGYTKAWKTTTLRCYNSNKPFTHRD